MSAKHWTDDDLMAHADGEGSAPTRAALDAALRDDAVLRDRWAALAAQRQRVSAAFAGVLDEPVPDRLAALLAVPAPAPVRAPVVDLATARAQRDSRRGLGGSWAQWGGLAASLALGLVLGWQWAPRSDGLLAESGGQVVAGRGLAQVLETRLASDGAAAGGLQVQLSFVDQGGRYCRTFSTERLAGLACQDGAQWTVQTTVGTEPSAPGPALRQAGTALPRALLDAVDQRIAGEALSAVQERAARDRGWRR